jgi:hypothetical protein
MTIETFVWAELQKFIQKGEQLIEGNLEHEAILVARLMHAERLAKNLAGSDDEIIAETKIIPSSKPTPSNN